jgi:hypothetical protein
MRTIQENHRVSWLENRGSRTCLAIELTPVKAIRRKCLDCSAGSAHEVLHCPITDCPLYPYRLGHRPRIESEAQES